MDTHETYNIEYLINTKTKIKKCVKKNVLSHNPETNSGHHASWVKAMKLAQRKHKAAGVSVAKFDTSSVAF